MAKSDTIQVQAFSLVFSIPAIPEEVGRLAFAKAEDDEGQADEQVETLHQPEDLAEAVVREDLEEEEQNRGFDRGETDVVKDLEDVEELPQS